MCVSARIILERWGIFLCHSGCKIELVNDVVHYIFFFVFFFFKRQSKPLSFSLTLPFQRFYISKLATINRCGLPYVLTTLSTTPPCRPFMLAVGGLVEYCSDAAQL